MSHSTHETPSCHFSAEMSSSSHSQSEIKEKRRGRKPILLVDNNKKVVLKQHHFDYSEDFAERLSTFAKAHLDNNSKAFKTAWLLWKDANSDRIQNETMRMKDAGYEGNVEDKMYFSARYYYRKKAIREEEYPTEDEKKTPRKKYVSMDKMILKQMNDHILSHIYGSGTDEQLKNESMIVSNIVPSNAFLDYCSHFGISSDDVRTKKNYKNLFWRISKKVSNITV